MLEMLNTAQMNSIRKGILKSGKKCNLPIGAQCLNAVQGGKHDLDLVAK